MRLFKVSLMQPYKYTEPSKSTAKYPLEEACVVHCDILAPQFDTMF